MKKIFTLTSLLLTLASMAHAQTVLLDEGFNSGLPSTWTIVDADGDGDCWKPSNTVGQTAMISSSYETVNFTGLTPDNWLITPMVEGADKLYYMVANSAHINNPQYFPEHYGVFTSTTGNAPADFTKLFDETLTETEAQFHYQSRELKLPAGTKYVAFRHYDITNICSVLIDGVKIVGASDDNTPIALPYLEQFDNNVIPSNWSNIDSDGDGEKWVGNVENFDYEHKCAMSASWKKVKYPLTPDNWLITPNIDGVKSVKYDVAASDLNDFSEHYSIMVSSTTNDITAFTSIFSETLTAVDASYGTVTAAENMKPRGINVPEGTKYIAFRHHDCTGQYWLLLDNMLFSKDEITSVEGVGSERVRVYSKPGLLIIDNALEGSIVEVYTIDGRMVAKQLAVSGSNEIALPAASYLVKVGAKTSKVQVQ